MSSCVASKLLKALDCLLTENFTIQDKTLLEKLLTSLNDADSVLSNIPIATHSKWFLRVLDIYKQKTVITEHMSRDLYAFALKYLAILLKSRDNLVILMDLNILQLLIQQVKDSPNLKDSAIFNSYITLLQSLNTQKLGIEHIVKEGLWLNILFKNDKSFVMGKFMEVQTIQYIADLVYRTFDFDITHFNEPILHDIFSELCYNDELIENCEEKAISTYNFYLKMLIVCLERFLGTKYQAEACKTIILNYSLKDILKKMNTLLKLSPYLSRNCVTLHLLLDCYTVWPKLDMELTFNSLFSNMDWPDNPLFYKQVNNWYTQAIKYLNAAKINDVCFEKELIIGQLKHIEECTKWLKFSNSLPINVGTNIVEFQYVSKCNEVVFDPTIIKEIAISVILNVTDVVYILKQESLQYLNTLFLSILDFLLHSDVWLEKNPEYCMVQNYKNFLELLPNLFICWTKILEERKPDKEIFTDDNSLSVSLIQNYSTFLQKSSHNSAVLQTFFKLISISFNKRVYEIANNKDDFRNLCNTLSILLLDTRPEVRDSCLDCITNITVASKYNTGHFLVKCILENQLPASVYKSATYDSDPYVKAKALECLIEMVSVMELGTSLLKETDILIYSLDIMQMEPEGVIRRQAVKLITALYDFDYLSNQMFNDVCIVMVHVSLQDPLWEVKKFAYEFWDTLIKKCTQKTCDDSTNINVSFDFVMLSQVGCLHVLYMALNDECDLEVQNSAVGLTRKLLISPSSDPNVSQSNKNDPARQFYQTDDDNNDINSSVQCKKSRHTDSSDRVLNSITTSCDGELLSSLKCASNRNIYPSDVCLRTKTDVYILPDKFLDFAYTYDFENYTARKKWIIYTRSGLNSMLDDIIGQSNNCFVEGADLLDCY
ncbi:uncharacterized protein LOC126832762 [Adelges cooleyi]|uniref:uncharacterized protein LOC126832762 n=1 Tax=Adelges cooleyi TaxID=133065 RepID=UPI00217F9C96|nr:uncharacterized protein LOC126832762 [Adelges cooleyi]